MRTRVSSSGLRWVEVADSLREVRAIGIGNESEGYVALAVMLERLLVSPDGKGMFAGVAHCSPPRRKLRFSSDLADSFFLRFKLRCPGPQFSTTLIVRTHRTFQPYATPNSTDFVTKPPWTRRLKPWLFPFVILLMAVWFVPHGQLEYLGEQTKKTG
jgi:hypothetical protein